MQVWFAKYTIGQMDFGHSFSQSIWMQQPGPIHRRMVILSNFNRPCFPWTPWNCRPCTAFPKIYQSDVCCIPYQCIPHAVVHCMCYDGVGTDGWTLGPAMKIKRKKKPRNWDFCVIRSLVRLPLSFRLLAHVTVRACTDERLKVHAHSFTRSQPNTDNL